MQHGLPPSLVEAAEKITEKKSREQEEIQKFMRQELEKLGVNSPAELSREKRKDLFNKVDKRFTSDAEESGKDVEPEDKETLKKESVNEGSNPATGLDTAEERFFRVEVLNGATGATVIFMIAAPDRKSAEKQALFAAKDEKELQRLPNQGGHQLVVDSAVEISEEEFESGDLAVNEARNAKF